VTLGEFSPRKDIWAAGALYEPYVGRWSRLVAGELLKWLSIPAQKDWLVVGCGTGALSQIILEHGRPRAIKGIDASAGFLAHAKAHVESACVTFEVGDARALPIDSASFDAVVSGLLLNFVPQPGRAVAQMARVAQRGGAVAAYVWDYAEKMEMTELLRFKTPMQRHSLGPGETCYKARARPQGSALSN
jgi:ubiquinone/menaquinone biosynthesis C-methylase UbiE